VSDIVKIKAKVAAYDNGTPAKRTLAGALIMVFMSQGGK